MSRKKKITLDELAEELGISRFTVSKALRGLPGMSDETRQAVLELARKRGYTTREQKESAIIERVAQVQLQQRRFLFLLPSDSIALPEIHLLLMQGIHERYGMSNYQVSPLFIPASFTREQSLEEWAEQSGLVHADGVFIPPMLPAGIENKLLELKIPRILINFPPIGAKVDSVIWDAYDSVRQAVHYLQQQGHTRILYTGDITSMRGYRLRWSAFQEVMSAAGLPVDPLDHMTISYSQCSDWIEKFRQTVLRTRPTAMINTIAADLPWLLYGAGSAGIQVPHSCCLVNLGFMASTGDETYNHTYTPIKEAGYRAAELMIWRIANPLQPYEHIRLQVELRKELIAAETDLRTARE